MQHPCAELSVSQDIIPPPHTHTRARAHTSNPNTATYLQTMNICGVRVGFNPVKPYTLNPPSLIPTFWLALKASLSKR